MKFLKNIRQIYNGWKNLTLHELGFDNPEVERIAKLRSIICAECSSFGGEQSDCSKIANKILNPPCCKECGCPLSAKTRTQLEDKLCPKNLWNE